MGQWATLLFITVSVLLAGSGFRTYSGGILHTVSHIGNTLSRGAQEMVKPTNLGFRPNDGPRYTNPGQSIFTQSHSPHTPAVTTSRGYVLRQEGASATCPTPELGGPLVQSNVSPVFFSYVSSQPTLCGSPAGASSPSSVSSAMSDLPPLGPSSSRDES